jgi:hypothetical protein
VSAVEEDEEELLSVSAVEEELSVSAVEELSMPAVEEDEEELLSVAAVDELSASAVEELSMLAVEEELSVPAVEELLSGNGGANPSALQVNCDSAVFPDPDLFNRNTNVSCDGNPNDEFNERTAVCCATVTGPALYCVFATCNTWPPSATAVTTAL